MKFSLHYTMQSDGSWSKTYSDFLSEVALAESLGYHAVYVGEHHFAPDGWCPSPVPVLAAAASVTKKMRVGTDILLLALHNPVEVAENISVLDNLSNGRATLGIGLGYRKEEYIAFSTNFERKREIYEEKISVVKSLLEGNETKVNGILLKVYPSTVQKPRPPIWLAAKSDTAIKAVLRRGDAWIMDPVTPVHLLEKKLSMFRENASKMAKKITDFPLRRECFVSNDIQEVKKATELILHSYEEDYYRWGHLMTREGEPVDPNVTPFSKIRDDVLNEMLIGKPSEVTEKLDQICKKLQPTEILIKIMFPGITHEMRVESLKVIANQVMPHFRDNLEA